MHLGDSLDATTVCFNTANRDGTDGRRMARRPDRSRKRPACRFRWFGGERRRRAPVRSLRTNRGVEPSLPPGPPANGGTGTLILQDVDAMPRADQRRLCEWLEDAAGRTRVVSHYPAAFVFAARGWHIRGDALLSTKRSLFRGDRMRQLTVGHSSPQRCKPDIQQAAVLLVAATNCSS
jgi:hypothetical protein